MDTTKQNPTTLERETPEQRQYRRELAQRKALLAARQSDDTDEVSRCLIAQSRAEVGQSFADRAEWLHRQQWVFQHDTGPAEYRMGISPDEYGRALEMLKRRWYAATGRRTKARRAGNGSLGLDGAECASIFAGCTHEELRQSLLASGICGPVFCDVMSVSEQNAEVPDDLHVWTPADRHAAQMDLASMRVMSGVRTGNRTLLRTARLRKGDYEYGTPAAALHDTPASRQSRRPDLSTRAGVKHALTAGRINATQALKALARIERKARKAGRPQPQVACVPMSSERAYEVYGRQMEPSRYEK